MYNFNNSILGIQLQLIQKVIAAASAADLDLYNVDFEKDIVKPTIDSDSQIGYELLPKQPVDWDTDWGKYYLYDNKNDTYVKLSDWVNAHNYTLTTAPEFYIETDSGKENVLFYRCVDNITELIQLKAKLRKVYEKLQKLTIVTQYAIHRREELTKQHTKSDAINKILTVELYDMLPQFKNIRMCMICVRDELVKLNYTFFGYVASKTTIVNSSVSYEDKFQSASCAYCKNWWWYGWKERYRTDLSFAVFFKLRIGEEVERELNEVKYSLRRTLCMEVGKQLGKHWGQVKYEDLADPRLHLPVEKLNSLKAMFGVVYWADLSEHENYIEAPQGSSDILKYVKTDYDTIEEFLIQEMIINETALSEEHLAELSEISNIPVSILQLHLPEAMRQLHERLTRNLDD